MTALLNGTLTFDSKDTLNRMLLLCNMLSQLGTMRASNNFAATPNVQRAESHQGDLFNQWVPSLLLIAQRTEELSAMSLCASTFLKLLGNGTLLSPPGTRSHYECMHARAKHTLRTKHSTLST